MRFHLSDEQVAIQDALRGALKDAFDRPALHRLVDGEDEFHPPSWRVLSELGLFGVAAPEAQGGSGLGLVDAALALEVLGEGAAAGPCLGQVLAALALCRTDNAAARERWLEDVLSGRRLATLAFGGKWLPQTWTVRETAGHLSGKVRFVPSAAAAGCFLVGLQGGGLALAEHGEGVAISPLKSTDRSRRASAVEFSDAPCTMLFPPGSPEAGKLFDAALVLLSADALGGAQHCLDLSVAYAKERVQFDRPIGQFQALKHQLATMALEVEPCRGLLWYAAYAQDAGLADAAQAASMAKAHICERYVSVARAAVAAHGGIGYTWEYGLHIWLRRALFDQAFLGSPSVHRRRAAQLSSDYTAA